MNPTPSKPQTMSTLTLVLLYLLSIHPMISADSTPAPRHHPPKPHAPSFRSWCKTAQHSKLCTSIVEADHQECWKESPEGVALILIKEAKANRRKTVSFIKRHLKNATDVGIRKGLEQCLFGYGTVRKGLDISICQLSDPGSRSEVVMGLNQVDEEVSYDCEWYQPDPFPLILKKMFKRVNRFSAILLTAEEIINLI